LTLSAVVSMAATALSACTHCFDMEFSSWILSPYVIGCAGPRASEPAPHHARGAGPRLPQAHLELGLVEGRLFGRAWVGGRGGVRCGQPAVGPPRAAANGGRAAAGEDA
jgi:hypothetical protein